MVRWPDYNARSKYGNEKAFADGMQFDSRKEAERYRELTLLQRAGEIEGLRTQVKYVLIPAQREPDTVGPKGGVKKGKIIERECAYYADFVYRDRKTGEEVVEDAKGMRTKEYKIKRKMMLYFHGIRISEV